MINALLNTTMARQVLRCIDLTLKYLGRYSVFARETNYNLELQVKTFIDYVGTIFLVLLLSPLSLLVALLVKLSSPGPVIYRQERAGLNGRRFMIYKFRTMVANAESLRSPLENRNEMDGPVFKIENDPRITRIGRFLRKTSLDELCRSCSTSSRAT